MDEFEDETLNTEEPAYTAMSDDEIKEAAEKIQNPYAAYTNYDYYHAATYAETAPAEPVRKPGGFSRVLKFVGLAACFGAIAGGTFFGVTYGLDAAFGDDSPIITASDDTTARNNYTQVGISKLAVASTETTDEVLSKNNVVVDVAKANMSCSVCVNCTYVKTYRDLFGRSYQQEGSGGGSGFIIGQNETELLVATNNHVVESATKVSILFCDDNEVSGTVRATDPSNDLAIVSIALSDISADTMNAITIAKLGDSDDAQVGEMVIAIGNALGYGQSVTVGYLSAKDRVIDYEGISMTLLQTDAAINEGNSGGPLFNTDGEVIGINCAKLASESVEGMCFAIPISAAMPILEDLMSREIVAEGEQGYLGVNIMNVSTEMIEVFGWPKGIAVTNVVEGGAAEKAGILKQDIITAVNGKSVNDTDTLINNVTSHKYGTTVTITLMRQVNGEWTEMNIDVTLMKRPE